MADDTFVPVMAPSVQNTQKNITYLTKKASFGDNYVQIAKDGINNKKVIWTVQWDMILDTDADTIEAFMDGLGGSGTFTYTMPTDIQRRYTCGTIVRTPLTGNFEQLTTTFEEFIGS